MTYREALQIQIKALQEIDANLDLLRDVASLEDKEIFNEVRWRLPDVWHQLQRIDDRLKAPEALSQLKGDYSIIVKKGDC